METTSSGRVNPTSGVHYTVQWVKAQCGLAASGQLNRTQKKVHINCKLTCFLNSSTWGPRVWGSASWTNRMTSSTDQEEASFPEPSLSCFTWSGPVVELAAVDCEGKRRESQIKLMPKTFIKCYLLMIEICEI